MKKLLVIGLWIAGTYHLLQAQNLEFYGIIPMLSQTGRITNRVNYNFFISETFNLTNRVIDGISYPAKPLQLNIQPSVIYTYSPDFNMTGGFTYNYQRSNPDVPYFKEWRTWEQVVYGHRIAHGRMTHRLRYEQRFIKNENTGERPMTTRLRYQLGFNIPLEGKTLDAGEWYFNCYDEPYFTLTVPPGTTRNALYSENWLYAGIGYQTKKMGRMEVGPLLQFNVRDIEQDLRNLYLLQMAWITNFNVSLKKKTLPE
ncbi:MAG: hypothetical protein JWO58_1934 [Chitinophagaceae bacterium]|nr:hypothetical protein [Chitinophagaceae bacterium]